MARGRVGGGVRRGWLHRIHRGVYAVGHPRLTREGRWMAAVLAVGAGAVLSHHPAAALWRLARWPGCARCLDGDPLIDVTLPGRSGRRPRRGIRLHRPRELSPAEATEHHGIRVTTAARTILDLAGELPRRRLERLLDEAERLRCCRKSELWDIARRHVGQGAKGPRALSAVLRSHQLGSTATRNDFEETFLSLCRKRGLPQPRVSAPLLGLTIDFLWKRQRVGVETDGRGSHDTRRGFQDDRGRDSLLATHGYQVLRFTWWDVTRRPGVVADRVRRVLARAEAP